MEVVAMFLTVEIKWLEEAIFNRLELAVQIASMPSLLECEEKKGDLNLLEGERETSHSSKH